MEDVKPAGQVWVKSSHSRGISNCVELSAQSGTVRVRNSRHPNGPELEYTPAEIRAFIAGAKDGEFDDLIS